MRSLILSIIILHAGVLNDTLRRRIPKILCLNELFVYEKSDSKDKLSYRYHEKFELALFNFGKELIAVNEYRVH